MRAYASMARNSGLQNRCWISARILSLPNACVSDRRQRETDSRVKTIVEAASCSLDAMVRPHQRSNSINVLLDNPLGHARPRNLVLDVENKRRNRGRRHVINDDVRLGGKTLE